MFTVSAMGLLVHLSPAHMRGRISGYYAAAFLLGNLLGSYCERAGTLWYACAVHCVWFSLLAAA